jgi:hypothetical protein
MFSSILNEVILEIVDSRQPRAGRLVYELMLPAVFGGAWTQSVLCVFWESPTGRSRLRVIDDLAMTPLSEPERHNFWEIFKD